MLCLCSGEIYNNLLIFTDIKSLLKGVVVCELFWHKPQTLTVHCLWTGCVPTVCISAVGDSVHRTYFTICPVCEDTSGRAGEGKETQHSFEELGLLDGNNHHGRKTRLKIATASLWHCGRLQFFHRWLFHAHIRTRKVDMEVTFRCKRLITFLAGGGLISTLLLNWIQAASSA